MEIIDIYIRTEEKVVEGLSLPIDINLMAIDPSYLKEERLYFTDQGKIVGYLESDLIVYLQRMSRDFIYKSIVDTIEDGVIAVDEGGRIFYANKAYSKILGVKLYKIIGRKIAEVEKDATINQVLKHRKAMDKKNNYIKSLDKYIDVRIRPIFNETRFIGAFSIFHDVSEINILNKKVMMASQMAEEYNRQLEAQKRMKELNIIGKSPNYLKLVSKAVAISKTDATVLIGGENGAGKDVICQLIHKNSLRNKEAFVSLNCAAIPENLIESEMFGYEEGAFTGAMKGGKIGKFELADKGTIFLDEIGDMSLSMQAKLLRVLESGQIEKIGSQKNIRVDVRVIAATNQDLEEMIARGEFREDLYYRLSVITLELPPLRKRSHDIVLFATHYLNYYNEKYEKDLSLSKEALKVMESYSWPGNIRELKNCIEHAVILADDGQVDIDDLPARIQKSFIGSLDMTLEEMMEEKEIEIIRDLLIMNKGDLKKTADQLAISERTLYRKINKYSIELTRLS